MMENGTNGVPKVDKRKRTSVACQRCRERKLRCDGAQPACQACQRGKWPCQYRDPKSPRVQFVVEHGHRRRPPFERALADPEPLTKRSRQIPAEGITKSNDASPEIRSIRLPFFRWFGPTGIAPGYKKMLVDVRQPGQADINVRPSSVSSEAEARGQLGRMKQIMTPSPLFEDDQITPRSSILDPLLEAFFDHYGCHFPFYSRQPFMASVKARKVSALLLNSICGLAARFATQIKLPDGPLHLRGEVFSEKAKLLLVPLLNLPSYEVVASMLMIVWLELASNHDVGVWMYMGMTCRMAIDLGMHKATISGPKSIADPQEYWVVSNLFWAVSGLDHIIALATGRLTTMQREHIDVPYPPSLSPEQIPIETSPEDHPSAFVSTIVVSQTQGLVNNEITVWADQSAILDPSTRERLMRYNDELIMYYTSLHRSLTFNVSNFQTHAAKGEGGTFLLLHLWFNAVMIAIHRPGLRYGEDAESNHVLLNNESRGIALSSARTISSILSLVEVVDPKSVLASPFTDQAIEMAGLVFIVESSTTSNALKRITNRSNYEICLRTLQALMVYWKGIGWVTTTMEQKSKGMKETDPGEGSVDPRSLIDLQDTKMIQKLLEKVEPTTSNHPLGNAENRKHRLDPHFAIKIPAKSVNPRSAIGVGFSGMSSSSAQGSIMFLQSAAQEPQETLATSLDEDSAASDTALTSRPENTFISQSAMIDGDTWTNWIDHGFWDDLDVPIDMLMN